MKLENEFLLVEIAAQGAEVTRIFNKKDETDVLWEGNPVFWCRHSPLLFPYVGKTYQNKLWIDGKQYDTEKHGFARTSLFDCVAESENSVTYMLKDSEETKIRRCISASGDIRRSVLRNRKRRRQIMS